MDGKNKGKKRKVEKLRNKIARNILSGTFNATAWTFDFLANTGLLTIEVFFNPSIYRDHSYVNFNSFSDTKKKFKIQEPAIKQSLWRLKKAGFVAKKGREFYLTKKGKELARCISGRKNIIEKKWDRKFRVVVFDIPEKKRKTRDWLRQELMLLNYKKLQESVFAGKFPLPEDLIKNIKSHEIGNCVNYMLVEKIYKNVF
jgi:DNA-binding transcriptional regulator PaaX